MCTYHIHILGKCLIIYIWLVYYLWFNGNGTRKGNEKSGKVVGADVAKVFVGVDDVLHLWWLEVLKNLFELLQLLWGGFFRLKKYKCPLSEDFFDIEKKMKIHVDGIRTSLLLHDVQTPYRYVHFAWHIVVCRNYNIYVLLLFLGLPQRGDS